MNNDNLSFHKKISTLLSIQNFIIFIDKMNSIIIVFDIVLFILFWSILGLANGILKSITLTFFYSLFV